MGAFKNVEANRCLVTKNIGDDTLITGNYELWPNHRFQFVLSKENT